MTSEAPKFTEDSVPIPTGFNLLIELYLTPETYGDSGIIKSHREQELENNSTVVGRVHAMGPDAYSDTARYPNGPWCEVGDYVIFKAYSGVRFKIHGKEVLRLIHDDMVEAVVNDPTGYSRI